MKKLQKLLLIIFTCVLFLQSFLYISFSDSPNEVVYPSKSPFDVVFNGNTLSKDNKRFPLIFYKNIIYLPLHNELGEYFGFEYLGDKGFRSIKKVPVKKTDWSQINIGEKPYKTDIYMVSNFHLRIDGKISTKEIDQSKEKFPFLLSNDTNYLPLTWQYATDVMGWTYEFIPEKGLFINTTN